MEPIGEKPVPRIDLRYQGPWARDHGPGTMGQGPWTTDQGPGTKPGQGPSRAQDQAGPRTRDQDQGPGTRKNIEKP